MLSPILAIPLPPTSSLRLDTHSSFVNPKAYQGLIGRLIFLTKTQPNIAYATSILSMYMHKLQTDHWNVAMTLISYLAKYPSLGLWYAQGEGNTLQGSSDLDYAGNIDERTSTSGYLFTNGSTLVLWSSKKQNSTSRSFCESRSVSRYPRITKVASRYPRIQYSMIRQSILR